MIFFNSFWSNLRGKIMYKQGSEKGKLLLNRPLKFEDHFLQLNKLAENWF